ncbi:putative transposase-like protein [Trichonephila clavipes]|nr:putative transposase-like protein [Trichonephila clavipes]
MNVRGVKKICVCKNERGTVDGYKWRCRNQSKDNRHDVVRSVRKGPETGAHTNSIEGTWSAIKKGLHKAHVKGQFDFYLAEYMWRRSNGHELVDENFHKFLASIARVYAPTDHDEMQA